MADAPQVERELREITELRQRPCEYGDQNLQINRNQWRDMCQLCFKEGHAAKNCGNLLQQPQQVPTRTDLGTPIEIYQICKKRRHNADRYRFQVAQTRQPINTIQRSIVICQLCSKIVHDVKLCRISEQNNKGRIICHWCDRSGHSANNCWKKQTDQRNSQNQETRTLCPVYNNFGHLGRDCRSRMNQPVQTRNHFCRYCKEQGHLLEDCESSIASNKRRQENNQGNFNDPWKSGTRRGPKNPHARQRPKEASR